MYRVLSQDRLDNGLEVYTVLDEIKNSPKRISRDQLVFLVGKGEVTGANGVLTGQLYQGKVIVRGIRDTQNTVNKDIEIKSNNKIIGNITNTEDINKKDIATLQKEALLDINNILKTSIGTLESKLFVKGNVEKFNSGAVRVVYRYLYKENSKVILEFYRYGDDNYDVKFISMRDKYGISFKTRDEVMKFMSNVRGNLLVNRLITDSNNKALIYKNIVEGTKIVRSDIKNADKQHISEAINSVAYMAIIHEIVLDIVKSNYPKFDRNVMGALEWCIEDDEIDNIRVRADIYLHNRTDLGIMLTLDTSSSSFNASAWVKAGEDPLTYSCRYSQVAARDCMYSAYADLMDSGIVVK